MASVSASILKYEATIDTDTNTGTCALSDDDNEKIHGVVTAFR
jgi:hypothetical protein